MNDDLTKEKMKTKDILIEIDNLKKYINGLTNNVRSDKLESFIDNMDKSIIKFQDETELFYNDKFKEINTNSK